ncbi:MAG: hypothetical protein JO270_03395, partial [Acidobacteriaceae bacterium]|nr:hypothetical protein [Acidobacteriaceae bacterium]
MSTAAGSTVVERSRLSYEIKVGGFFLLALAVIAAYAFSRRTDFRLTLEMSSSHTSRAQLFYSGGGGYSENDSRQAFVRGGPLTTFQVLTFDLPVRTIRNLRFDPLMTAGTFIIRNVVVRSGKTVLVRIPASDIVAFNQIATRQQEDNAVLFSTLTPATDPGVIFRLDEPLRLRHVRLLQRMRRLVIGVAVLLVLCAAMIFYRDRVIQYMPILVSPVRRIDGVFGRVASRISNPDFLTLDSYAIWFYAVCILLFCIAAAGDLNGSSAEIMAQDYHHGPDSTILLGAPRGSRSDEWSYFTPDIMNQVFRADRFAAERTQLGGHFIGLTGNIPVLHISTLFRPQLWSYFVLPADYAFAVNWQFKALLLISGIFTWLLLFTRSTLWAATGSLWFFFSPETQWDYSWASALPEMIGLMCFGTILACYLTIGRNRIGLLAAGVGLAACLVDFTLCAYLPHIIPLAWIGILFFAGWCCAKREVIFDSSNASFRILAIGVALGIVAAIGSITYRDLHDAIVAVSNTVYPGQRRDQPGQMPGYLLLSHFMQWTETEGRFPAALGNMCEGSGYFWLAPITLFCCWRLHLSRLQKFTLALLWLCFCLFLAWMFLPAPAIIGAWTGLNRSGYKRIMPALGLVNIGIVVLCGARFRVRHFRFEWMRWVIAFTGLGVCFLALRYANEGLGSYFTSAQVALFAIFVTLLVWLYLRGWKRAFALTLVIPQAIVFGAVNPVQRGLPMFVNSDLRRFVAQHPDLLKGKWIVFSNSVVSSGFVAATGVDVYTGLHYIPHIDDFPIYAAHHLDLDILNRDGYLDAHLRTP